MENLLLTDRNSLICINSINERDELLISICKRDVNGNGTEDKNEILINQENLRDILKFLNSQLLKEYITKNTEFEKFNDSNIDYSLT